MNSLKPSQWAVLLAVAGRVVPETAGLDEAGRDRLVAIVDDALAERPASVRRRLGLFLTLVQLLPLARHGRGFTRLPGETQDHVLRGLQDARIGALRQGFWGVKALALMGYYGQVESWPVIGYAPSFDGNARLHAGA